ncbi:hypothetical protein Bbelb_292890 [Branchiostoma belcheri]|nr:hypothetical protein Bbelb_292890 [Branchiostoma belcheri]
MRSRLLILTWTGRGYIPDGTGAIGTEASAGLVLCVWRIVASLYISLTIATLLDLSYIVRLLCKASVAKGKVCVANLEPSFAGDCYQFSTSAATHRDATQACSANSGRMVDLRDPQQQQFLANTIAASTGVSNWLAMKTAPLPILYSDGSPVLVPILKRPGCDASNKDNYRPIAIAGPLLKVIESLIRYLDDFATAQQRLKVAVLGVLYASTSYLFAKNRTDTFDAKRRKVTHSFVSRLLSSDNEIIHLLLHSDAFRHTPLQWLPGEPSSPLDLCVLLDSSNNYQAKTVFCTEEHSYVCMSGLKPCEPNVCQNGGNCTSCFGESTNFCDCLDGFEGLHCEIDTDECASNPCQHGGTCRDQVNSYSCRCPTGYDGDNCQVEIDWCSMVTCPFGWTCQNLITHFSCLAPTVRKLQPYKCSSASCPADMYCKEESGASFSCWAN